MVVERALTVAARSKWVAIGDSITDAGRGRPVGEGLFDGLGKGYVAMADALVGAIWPERHLRVANTGQSGDTVVAMAKRWQTDVLDLKPDYVSVMIGTNDVWRQFDLPTHTEKHVDPATFAATLDGLVTRTLPVVRGMLLMTPFYIESNRSDAMRARMDEYGRIVRETAEKRGTAFVDTQSAFDEVMERGPVYAATLAWDRVHPNMTGHMILARAVLAGLGMRVGTADERR